MRWFRKVDKTIQAILEVILAAHRAGATREEIVFMLRRAADDIEGTQ
jgi:hypothetical protein